MNGQMDTDHLLIDTKGMCLLCLRECKQTENPRRDKDEQHTSFSVIMRYLKISVFLLSNSSSLMSSVDEIDDTDVVVTLCDSCSRVLSEFSELNQQLERIRLQMGNCVETVRDLIDEAERNTEVKEEFGKRLRRARNAFEFFNASLAENLRKETKHKCDLKLKEITPKGTLKSEKVEPGHVSPSHVKQSNSPQKGTLSKSPPRESSARTYAAVAGRLEVATTSAPDMPTSRAIVNEIAPSQPMIIDPAFKVETVFLSDDSNNSFEVEDEQVEFASEMDDTSTSPPPPMISVRKPGPASRSSRKTPSKSCHICGKCFKTPQQLRRHIPVHSGLRPHKCEYCGRAFTQGCNLRTHTMSVHTMEVVEKSLPPRCTEDHLNKAIKLILDKTSMFPEDRKTPCGCPHCERRFRSKFELRTHILQGHFEVVLARIRNLGNLSKRKSDPGSREETPVIVASTSYSNFDNMEQVLPFDEPAVNFVEQDGDIQILDPLYI